MIIFVSKYGHRVCYKCLNIREMRKLKIFGIVFFTVWAVILIVLQVALSSSFLTRMANKYAAEYVDGKINFGTISASVIRSFPNLNISVDRFSITYPHDRFTSYDSLGIRSFLREKGKGEMQDTLASFDRLDLSVNYISAIFGKINIRKAELDKARIFAHQYDSLKANWNIFKTSSEGTDDGSSGLPHLIVKRLYLTGRPEIVYTDFSDTLFYSLKMRETRFDGKLDIRKLNKHRIGLEIDSLFVTGRMPSDTLALALDKFQIKEKSKSMFVEANATAYLAMQSLGRLAVPIGISGNVDFPEEGYNKFNINDLSTKIATLDLRGKGDFNLGRDSSYVRAELSLLDCPVDETLDMFAKNIMPESVKLKTDAKISVTALCDGWYNPKRETLPELVAELVIPESSIEYEGLKYKGKIAAEINAETDKYGKLGVTVNNVDFNAAGISLVAKGSAEDVLGQDPLFDINLDASASMDTLNDFLPKGTTAEGMLEAHIEGLILLSDIDPYNFSRADLTGYLRSKSIRYRSPADSIFAYIGNTDLEIGRVGERAVLGADIIGLKGRIDSVYTVLGESNYIRGRNIKVLAQNSLSTVSKEFGKEIHPIVGSVSAGSLAIYGADSLFIGLKNSTNSFKYSTRKDKGKIVPILAMDSKNDGIFIRSGVNRYGFRNAGFSASAVMRGDNPQIRRKHFLDSLQRVYPGVQRDSLFKKMILERRKQIPDYLQDKDFEKKDISFSVNETVADYVKNWNINGKMKIRSGRIITPYFPLRNEFSDIDGSFNNNEINLKNISLKSGSSDLSASGNLSGLKRILSGRKGLLNLKLDIISNKINANELLKAYDLGSKYSPSESKALDEKLSDDQYLAQVATDTLENYKKESSTLIVLPANLIADVSLQGNEIDYSELIVDWFAADLNLRERCLQITNTVATSNMGDIYFEGFYATRNKKDLSAGFDLNLVDITADKVITLFPAVDSILPMLKSFKGMLDCELAATSSLDTNMNLVPATINGIMKIGGKNLSVKEEGAIKRLARTLMFRNRDISHIDDMSVQGLVANNNLEIFPFVLKVDRYTLAMSGIQSFDNNFKYHISVLRSPIPFRFGINLYGNFDNWKYRLGKAKYKNTNVPVFTTQLNSMHLNLLNSIHNIFTKGVELAIQENKQKQQTIEEEKIVKGYDSNAPADSLSGEELKIMDSVRSSIEQPVDSSLSAKIDSVMNVEMSGDSSVQKALKPTNDKAYNKSPENKKAGDKKAKKKKNKGSSDKAAKGKQEENESE